MNSLNIRIQALESHLEEEEFEEPNPISRLVSSVKKKKQRKKHQYQKILDHFQDDLVCSNIDNNPDNFVQIVIFTVKYIENNSASSSKYIGLKVNSDFKLNLSLQLIKYALPNNDNDLKSCKIIR